MRHFIDRNAAPSRVDFTRFEGHVSDTVDLNTEDAIAKKHRQEWNRRLLVAVPWTAADRVVSGEYDPQWPAVQLATDWLQNASASRHIMFRGPTRSGKTLASTLIVRHWLEPGKSRGEVRILHPDALISAVLHDYDPQSPKLGRDVGLVVVDDIGRETKPGIGEALCQVLDRRALRVVMSTNLDKQGFRDRYQDARLLERLRESTFAADVKPVGERRPSGDF